MSFVIKICGLTSADDVVAATEAGATAIGINFWAGSRRFVGEAAAEVAAAVPAGVWRVGVFVNATAEEVSATAARHQLTHVQLHGDETPEAHLAMSSASGSSAPALLRALRVRTAASLGEAASWPTSLLLLDAHVEGYGGAGVTAPWAVISAHAPSRPFLLAGGLGPHNVAAAIAATRPSGVDVASGVELAAGKKSREKMVAFVEAARRASLEHPPRAPL